MKEEGRVLKTYSGYYYVATEDRVIPCKIKGRMKQRRYSLVTGDRVLIESDGAEGMVTDILPRSNFIDRPTMANLDLLLLTFACARPAFSSLIADKLLALAENAGVSVLLLLNKTDLVSEEEAKEIAALYEKAGYEVLLLSAKTGRGLDELREKVRGKTCALGGPSGVGKSSLVNALAPGALRGTGELSAKIDRGKHTTRYAELLPFAGGYLADTPGFGNVLLEEGPRLDAAAAFKEFAVYAGHCRYRPCSHSHEPGCAVKEAVKAGDIAPSRYENYLAILKEMKAWPGRKA